ncbi:unnamed protein product [Ceutorhynchus assimilis]|uniref:sulfite oxidase n=1 Tax=Ceutorhynchus assimilis TaxID=467358 RepID=A0A9N9MQW6_9CUCU|nr:unnamed protein product [Ceutorhynchus assimilis]
MKIILKSPSQSIFSIPHRLQYCRTLSHFPKTKEEQKNQKSYKNNYYKEKFTSKSVLLGAATTSLFAYYYLVKEKQQRYVYAAKEKENGKSPSLNPCAKPGLWRSDLPIYTKGEVAEHHTLKKGMWISYHEGVYDITDFVHEHPGRDAVTLAAGGPAEPFWAMYGFHEESPFILQKLETMRIGNLCKADQLKVSDFDDPYIDEPKRSEDIIPATKKPFAGTLRLDYLPLNFITPVQWWYVRNHLPVPDLDANNHQVILEVGGTQRIFTMDEIQQMPKACVMVTLMCSGNRGYEMLETTGTKTKIWGPGAVSNAIWTGVKLCDLLEAVGITAENHGNYKHVQFVGTDCEITGVPYSVSIPIWKAVDKKGDVLLAYQMNGEPLTRDHGYPIRMVVPGHTGARSCKWLTKIILSDKEADGNSQMYDFKSFGPSVRSTTADYEKAPSIQAVPVHSVICRPKARDSVQVVEGRIDVKGFAYAGGGNKIIRVDISTDQGKTWQPAQLDFQDNKSDYPHNWSWTLWSCKLPIDKNQHDVEIWCKAIDTSSNTQPEGFEYIYNFKGVTANAYHKIKFKLIPCNT